MPRHIRKGDTVIVTRGRSKGVVGEILRIVDEGDRVVVCTRDAKAARADLVRICTELRDELETDGLAVRGAVYVSCVARGRSLFGSPSAEVALIQSQLGEFPMVGFFANGEIANHQLYGYTGVLTLFTGPRAED